MTSTSARERFGEFLDQAQAEPVAVTQRGRVCAVLVAPAFFERLRELTDLALEADRHEREEYREALRRSRAGTPREGDFELIVRGTCRRDPWLD